ncbi:hypothetical protein LOS78_01640 [Paracoccus sp. MA]|uniref:hypothetical protein n=1 Tax=Paracoccus sp. MA TaxID=2895796 RepID=UPI001E57324A|nr:hypothetical protein [Paracoccus sp. MA]UFM64201.1 hypothetical protein LOS78_01640 [Paracoccus sp. MA]
MEEKFTTVEIGRSTWQGPAEEAPRRADLCASGQQVRALWWPYYLAKAAARRTGHGGE